MNRFFHLVSRVAFLSTPCLALFACGTSEPEQACLDTADATAKAAERCGMNYQTNYDAFVKASGGDCGNITSVRDENALRNTCFPALQATSCEDLKAGKVDKACVGQFRIE